MSSSPPGDKPVFFDLGGKRWPRARRLVVLSGVLLFLGMVCFVQSLLIAPPLVLPLKLKKLKEQLKCPRKAGTGRGQHRRRQRHRGQEFRPHSARQKPHLDALQNQLGLRAPRPPHTGGQIRLGYEVAWDPASLDSLVAHADKLTHVCPEWFTLSDSDGTFSAENDVALLQFMAANKRLVLLPMMTNFAGQWAGARGGRESRARVAGGAGQVHRQSQASAQRHPCRGRAHRLGRDRRGVSGGVHRVLDQGCRCLARRGPAALAPGSGRRGAAGV